MYSQVRINAITSPNETLLPFINSFNPAILNQQSSKFGKTKGFLSRKMQLSFFYYFVSLTLCVMLNGFKQPFSHPQRETRFTDFLVA